MGQPHTDQSLTAPVPAKRMHLGYQTEELALCEIVDPMDGPQAWAMLPLLTQQLRGKPKAPLCDACLCRYWDGAEARGRMH